MDASRRSFLRGKVSPPKKVDRPPWALRLEEDFLSACTRCHECVRVCPQKVLVVGDGGFPEIRFAEAGCTLCGECVTACAPRALSREKVPRALSREEAPRALSREKAPRALSREEVAQAFSERIRLDPGCLHEQGIECRLCGDACETRALRFRPRLGGTALLEVDREACTGCGACLALCPPKVLKRA